MQPVVDQDWNTEFSGKLSHPVTLVVTYSPIYVFAQEAYHIALIMSDPLIEKGPVKVPIRIM